MKKLVLVGITPFICFAQMDDYLPLSEFSNDKKIEYNFTDKQKKQELKKEEPTVKVITKEEIVQKPIKQEVEVIEVRKSILNDEVKQEDVLENKRDFKITLTSTANFYDVEFDNSSSDKDTAIENSIKISDDKHALAFTYLNMSNSFKQTGKTKSKLYSISYLYRYINKSSADARMILSANYLDLKCDTCTNDKFPSVGMDFNNSVIKNLVLNYGFSIGFSDDIDMVYGYNANLLYEVYPNIALNIGYKGRNFKYKNDENFEYSGLVTGLQATF